MESINFAYPYHDWDHEDGDEEQHYQRMLATKKEVQINLLINTVFNLILLFPLPLSFYFISERHHVQKDTIGTLPLEDVAYNQSWLFSWIFFIVVIVCAVFQYIFSIFIMTSFTQWQSSWNQQ